VKKLTVIAIRFHMTTFREPIMRPYITQKRGAESRYEADDLGEFHHSSSSASVGRSQPRTFPADALLN
jgi:hypothetical protein